MILLRTFSLLFVWCLRANFVAGQPSLQQNQVSESIRYSPNDVTDVWKPNKVNGIQDRFHPVTLHHVKPHHHPSKPNQLIQPPLDPNTQAIFSSNQQSLLDTNTQPIFSSNQQSFDESFRNEFPQFQQEPMQDPESHAGEIIPGLVNQGALQSLDFPVGNLNDYIAYIQTSTPPPSSTPSPVNLSGDSLKTVYVPWIYIPPGTRTKETHEHHDTGKTHEHEFAHHDQAYSHEYGYTPPKPTYLPPEPNYLPPAPSYLPPAPTYLPPDPTYLPPYTYPPPTPPPTYLPPHPGYLPPTPMPGYSYPIPPMKEEEEKAAEFTYFFLGRKLWYIPLYFSIYFVLYVGYLVLKAIARHKIKLPHLLHNAAVVSGRDLIQLGLYSSRDFNDMEDLVNTIARAAETLFM